MLKAVIRHGQIRPVEPLPVDWTEGQELVVEKAEVHDVRAEEVDRDFAVLTSMCESSEVRDEEQLEQALATARREAKERMRRDMGLG